MKKLKIFLFIFLLGVVTFFIISGFPNGSKLSSDQSELVDDLGYPTSYTIAFGETVINGEYKQVRYESWNYEKHGRSFLFVDGKFTADENIAFVDKADPFPITPNEFGEEMSFEEVKGIIGGEPNVSASVPESLLENAKVYDFEEQIKIGVINDKVIYIQTLPLKVN